MDKYRTVSAPAPNVSQQETLTIEQFGQRVVSIVDLAKP